MSGGNIKILFKLDKDVSDVKRRIIYTEMYDFVQNKKVQWSNSIKDYKVLITDEW